MQSPSRAVSAAILIGLLLAAMSHGYAIMSRPTAAAASDLTNKCQAQVLARAMQSPTPQPDKASGSCEAVAAFDLFNPQAPAPAADPH